MIGDSLLLDAVEAGLIDEPGLTLLRLHGGGPDIGGCLRSLEPHLVIFDLNGPQAQAVLLLLRDRPGIQLLGLDITCSKVLALSSRSYVVPTAEELAAVIHRLTAGAVEGEGDYDGNPGLPARAGVLLPQI